jgi:septal ring factor EnvC (AmiA/AmiB activator)
VDARITPGHFVPGAAHDDSDCSSALPRRAILVLAAMLLIPGCTYLQQKQDLMSGGMASREADANAKFQAARTQNQDLQDQQLQLDREIERNNKRISAARADLDRVEAELNAARKRNAVSEAEYRRLKGEVDRAQGDLASVNMQLDAERVTRNVDVAAKERQIQALEKKRSELEKAVGMSPRP